MLSTQLSRPRMPAPLKLFALLLLISLISACAKGPDSRDELAAQGLFDAEFSDDGNVVLIGSQLHGASLWEVSPLKRLYNWNHKEGEYSQITDVALSSDGRRAVTATGQEWVLWDATNGKALGFWQAGSDILDIALNNSGNRALIAQENGDVWLTDTRTGNNVKEFQHTAPVRAVAFSADEKLILSGGDDYKAIFWSTETGDALHTQDLSNMCRSVAFSPSGKLAFISSLRSDHLIISTDNFKPRATLNARYTIYNGAEFSSNEKQLAVANQQGYIQVFDTNSGEEIAQYKAQRKTLLGGVRSLVDLDLGNNQILAMSSDGQLQRFSR